MHIISRPTQREREERLAESRTHAVNRNVEGVVRHTEEAHEIERQRAKEGKPFDRPYEVSGNSPEAKQAETEALQRAGLNPDSYRGE
jgi:hypothetical protein